MVKEEKGVSSGGLNLVCAFQPMCSANTSTQFEQALGFLKCGSSHIFQMGPLALSCFEQVKNIYPMKINYSNVFQSCDVWMLCHILSRPKAFF